MSLVSRAQTTLFQWRLRLILEFQEYHCHLKNTHFQLNQNPALLWFLLLGNISIFTLRNGCPKIGFSFLLESNSIVLLILEFDQFLRARAGNRGSRKSSSSLKIQTGTRASSAFADPASPLRIWPDFQGSIFSEVIS